GGPREIIAAAPTLDLNMPVTVGGLDAPYGHIPALAVPTESKSSFELPTGHMERLAERLRGVDRLLVIGWRGQEQNFLDLCHQHVDPSRLKGMVVASDGTGAGETVSR